VKRLHEPVREWKPCSVCGHPAPYVHHGRRYCTRNACQVIASNTAPVKS
jgi:hypothetical protein